MASQTIHHTRSNSFPLPSRPNPLVLEIDEHLNRLRDSEATSTSSSICHKLNGLQDLYDGVDKLLDFPFFQQELAQEQKKGPVDELLDGSLRLFDLCNTAKDILWPKERLKCGSWAFVSKLLHHNWIGCEQARRRDINEFENVDAALRSVMSQKMSKSENVEMPRQLKELELCIQVLEDGLECLFKCIIKARVSLLNAFNR
ncbi:uncharacterized protein [Gossypium hirsutum]|uniref:DUF241 domain protein n=1 Tax=Gossypium hirsutum TaxID=3635 RepID=A0A1U8KNS6_GOSHI|nr:uncharacterized protein LOC107919076 [Gossypium hirsutum]